MRRGASSMARERMRGSRAPLEAVMAAPSPSPPPTVNTTGAFVQQGERLLKCEEIALDVDVEQGVEGGLVGGLDRKARTRQTRVEVEQVEGAQVLARVVHGLVDVGQGADVGLDGDDVCGKAGSADVPEAGDHDAVAARVEQFCGGLADPASSAGDECPLSRQLSRASMPPLRRGSRKTGRATFLACTTRAWLRYAATEVE